MAKALIAIILCLSFAAPVAAAEQSQPKAAPQSKPAWTELTPAQQQVLAPLKDDWSEIDTLRRNKWIRVADRYPKMKPDEQQRLQTRMKEWAALTPEQRRVAREKYQTIKKLPPDKREQVKSQWKQYQRDLLTHRPSPASMPARDRCVRSFPTRYEPHQNLASRNLEQIVPTRGALAGLPVSFSRRTEHTGGVQQPKVQAFTGLALRKFPRENPDREIGLSAYRILARGVEADRSSRGERKGRPMKRNQPNAASMRLHRRQVLLLGGGAALALAAPRFALAQKAKPIKVAAIYTVPVEQQWVSRIHKALNAAKDRGDITYKWSENTANTDYERVMRQFSTEGSDLIVGESFAVERAARKVASDFPKTAYLMGSSFGPSKPNYAVFDNFIHEPSYLTGMVAGKATKSNVIGMVGGYAIPEVNRLMNAFMEGALSVNKDVKFYVTFINSWYDPPKAKESAFAMIDKKADILYAERFGVSDAAKERGVKAIGNVIDTSAQYPGVVLASALWHMEPTIDRAIKSVIEGTFEPADYGPFSYMAHGGASLSPLDEKLVPKDVIELVKAKEKEILEGAFRVNVNDAEPKSNA